MHTYGNMLLTGTLLWLALYQQSPCCFFIQAPKGDAVYLRLAEDPASLYFLPLMPTLCSSRSSNSLWMFREKTTVSAAWSVMGVSRYQTRERALPNLLRYRSFLCICLSWCYQIWTGHTRIQDQVNYSYKSPQKWRLIVISSRSVKSCRTVSLYPSRGDFVVWIWYIWILGNSLNTTHTVVWFVRGKHVLSRAAYCLKRACYPLETVINFLYFYIRSAILNLLSDVIALDGVDQVAPVYQFHHCSTLAVCKQPQ